MCHCIYIYLLTCASKYVSDKSPCWICPYPCFIKGKNTFTELRKIFQIEMWIIRNLKIENVKHERGNVRNYNIPSPSNLKPIHLRKPYNIPHWLNKGYPCDADMVTWQGAPRCLPATYYRHTSGNVPHRNLITL